MGLLPWAGMGTGCSWSHPVLPRAWPGTVLEGDAVLFPHPDRDRRMKIPSSCKTGRAVAIDTAHKKSLGTFIKVAAKLMVSKVKQNSHSI